MVQDLTVHSKIGNLFISPKRQRLHALLLFHVRHEQLLGVGVVNNLYNLRYCPSLFQRTRSLSIPS